MYNPPMLAGLFTAARLRTAAIVAAICALALVLRTAPRWGHVFRAGYVSFQDSDAWFHMRIIDNLVPNLPHRMSADPYAAYPLPQALGVAPLFDYLVAVTAWVIGLGAPSARTVDVVGALAPAVLGAMMPALVYIVGSRLFDRLTGFFAAALIAVLPGHFLARSLLGFTDHHVLEALLATLTVLLLAVAAERAEPLARLGGGATAGVALGAFLLSWSGGALLVFILAAWAVVQYHVDLLRGRADGRIASVLLAAVVVALLLVLAFQDRRMYRYTTQLSSLGGAAAVVIVLEGLRRALAWLRWPRHLLPVAVLGLVVAGVAVFAAAAPALTASIVADMGRFTPADSALTVNEVRPLFYLTGTFTPLVPFVMFGTSFYIGAVALALLGYRVVRTGRAAWCLVFVWSAGMYAATLGQNRFGYYLAVNLALLTGWAGSLAFAWASSRRSVPADRRARRRQQTASAASDRLWWQAGVVSVFVALAVAPTVQRTLATARADLGLTHGWHVSLDWLRRNTPEPFPTADHYFARYTTHGTRPAYTIMSWWDYGYEIMRVARRVPSANPTQAGAGAAARFFTATTEATANAILDRRGARYVLVDWELPILPRGASPQYHGKFENLVAWADKPGSQFYDVMLEVNARGVRTPVILFYPEYYRTMAVRMYVFGGQAAAPKNSTWVITYAERPRPDGTAEREVLESARFATYEEAAAHLAKPGPAQRVLVGPDPRVPCVPIEALTTFRLVHDSPDISARVANLPSVRIFESLRSR
jgi:dolichyl-diphosphooligosaccharide--protein glycosyltransferase